jgi:GAF domain-containing protein
VQNFAAQAVIAMGNARLLTETREALEQQTATAEVLQVINSSPGDLGPVFDAMLDKAMHLCGAAFGELYNYDGEAFRTAALRGIPVAYQEFRERNPPLPDPGTFAARILAGERVVNVADLMAEEVYRTNSHRRAMVDLGGARAAAAVPLLQDERVRGVILIYKQEPRPFTDKQIALLKNFAAQAVIAMENARLLTETREALEQRTATAEVLQVINSSPGDLAPVFDAILEKAHSLCDTALGALGIFEGENFRAMAMRGYPQPLEERLRQGVRATDNPVTRPLLNGTRFVHIPDLIAIDNPLSRAVVELSGVRTVLFVPLRKDGATLGLISSGRKEVRPFSGKEIALLENFAAQAVIAMENARLLTETREALEQQTATAEVLRVINSSPGDLGPMFDAMLEKAMRLCEAPVGAMLRFQNGKFSLAASRDVPAPFQDFLRQMDYQPHSAEMIGQLQSGAPYVHLTDMKDDAAYRDGAPLRRAVVDLAGARTAVVVALRKDRELLGTFNLWRTEVRPFSDKQIALLENFAAQAVVAMENARLLTETREALQQQTATAEVLRVINSSPGDLAPVFDAILEKAHTLCGAVSGHLMIWDGECFETVAIHGRMGGIPIGMSVRPQPGFILDRAARGERGEPIIHVTDVYADPAYDASSYFRDMVDLGGVRTMLYVALRRKGGLLGVIGIYNRAERPFTDKQIGLLQNFAAQAVIAMENARLLTETREALEQQTATAEVLGVINSSPGDLAPVFDAMLEKATRLCGAIFGILWTYDGGCFRAVALHRVPSGLADLLRDPWAPVPGGAFERVLRDGLAHFVDFHEHGSEGDRAGGTLLRAFVDAGAKTGLLVALSQDDNVLGAIQFYRDEPGPFTEKQIALLQSFAAQAVIAMENARLLGELRASALTICRNRSNTRPRPAMCCRS